MEDEVASGWAWPDTQAKKYHYFDVDARHSLCGMVSGWNVWLVFVARPIFDAQCLLCQLKLVARAKEAK